MNDWAVYGQQSESKNESGCHDSALPTHDEALHTIDLRKSPPPRQYLVENLIPHPVCGLIVAPGGTGKSFLMLSLAVAVAIGRDFLGYAVAEPGSVVLLASEDDRDELHRRLAHVVQPLDSFEGVEPPLEVIDVLEQRLYVVPRVGLDSRLVARESSGVSLEPSEFLNALIEWCEQISDLRLVLLDPASRYFGGVENSAEDATRFVEAMESIRKATGATVIAVHHANKEASRKGDDSQAAARGSSALTDGVRWQAQLRTMRREEAKQLGGDVKDLRRFVRFEVSKMNYGAAIAPTWLERRFDGVLQPFDFAPGTAAVSAEQCAAIRDAVQSNTAKGNDWTVSGFVKAHGGKGTRLGIAEKHLRSLIQKMISTGDLRLIDGRDAAGRKAKVLASATQGGRP